MTIIVASTLLLGIIIGAFVKSAFKIAVIATLIVGAVYISGQRLPKLHEVVDGVQSEIQQLEVKRPTPIKPGIREAKRWM